jgi:hypothetical protein
MGINPWVGDRPARDEVVTLEVVSKTVAAAMEAGYTDTDSSEVFQLKAKLTAQLAELRTAVHEIESSAEFADTFLTTKLQGVASGSNQ